MHPRTQKLHQIMTDHQIGAREVAAILDCKENTVRMWRTVNPHRVIPAITLRLLEIEIQARSAA